MAPIIIPIIIAAALRGVMVWEEELLVKNDCGIDLSQDVTKHSNHQYNNQYNNLEPPHLSGK